MDTATVARFGKTLNDDSVGNAVDSMHSKSLTLVSSEKQLTIRDGVESEYKDSLIYFADSLFADLGSVFKEISSSQYNDAQKKNRRTCSIDSNGFVIGKGLILDHFCKDICELYLIDKKERIRLLLPSSYDQGIMGLEISPSCDQFIIYSSYDSPDYDEYYAYRAEIFGFSIAQGQGIQTIKPIFKFYTKDWSIEDVIWSSYNEIALKTYEESRSISNQDSLNYKYFKSKVVK